MHPELARYVGAWHEQRLLDEADTERLIVIARGRRERAASRAGNAAAWRRWLGWAVIDVGVRVAGGPIEGGLAPAGDCR